MRKETLFVRRFIWIIIAAYAAVSQVEASRATESHTTSAAATGAQTVENLIKVIENPINRELFLDSLKQIAAEMNRHLHSIKKIDRMTLREKTQIPVILGVI